MVLNAQGLYHPTQLWHIPWWQKPFFYYLLITAIVLFCIAIVWLVVHIVRRTRRAVVTPVQWALQELTSITAKNLIHPQTAKQFYRQLHIIIKLFLQKTYTVPLTSYTDAELIHYLSHNLLHRYDKDTLSTIKRILCDTMAIKFHIKQVTLEYLEKDFNDVVSFVRMHRAL